MDFETLASKESVTKTIAALKEKNIEGEYVENKMAALERIKTLIPPNASVQTGSSTTLDQIGLIEHLKSGAHEWNNLKEAIVSEKDPIKQAELRRQALLSDYYLGSVHGIAETGEFVIGSNTGSQMPHIVYSSPNLILVVSTKKIVPTLQDALKRLEEHVVPQEDERLKKATDGKYSTRLSKEVLFRYESPFNQRKVRILFVNENLGF